MSKNQVHVALFHIDGKSMAVNSDIVIILSQSFARDLTLGIVPEKSNFDEEDDTPPKHDNNSTPVFFGIAINPIQT